MKDAAARTTLLLAALTALCIVTGCGPGNTPEGAVQRLIAAAEAEDTEALLQCYDPDSRALMKAAMDFKKVSPFPVPQPGAPETPGDVRVVGSEIDGDTAVVTVAEEGAAGGKEGQIHCVKVEGTWYVSVAPPEQMSEMRKARESLTRAMKGVQDAAQEGAEDAEDVSEAMRKAMEDMGSDQ